MHGAGRGTETERSGQRGRWKRLRKRGEGKEMKEDGGGEKERGREGARGFRAEVVHQVYVCSPAAGGTTERKVVSILCNAERQESARIRRGSTSLGCPGGAPLSLEFGTTLRDHRRKLRKKPSPPATSSDCPLPCFPSVFFASCMSAISIIYPYGFDFNARTKERTRV